MALGSLSRFNTSCSSLLMFPGCCLLIIKLVPRSPSARMTENLLKPTGVVVAILFFSKGLLPLTSKYLTQIAILLCYLMRDFEQIFGTRDELSCTSDRMIGSKYNIPDLNYKTRHTIYSSCTNEQIFCTRNKISYTWDQISCTTDKISGTRDKISGTRDNCHFTALMSCSPGTSALWPPWVSSLF